MLQSCLKLIIGDGPITYRLDQERERDNLKFKAPSHLSLALQPHNMMLDYVLCKKIIYDLIARACDSHDDQVNI